MSAPHDRPTAAELVAAVGEWIRRSQVDDQIQPNSFHARVAVNMLAIVERELSLGADQERAHAARLAELGVADDVELAAAIRSGELDERAEDVRRLVRESVRDKLAVANPKYLHRVEELAEMTLQKRVDALFERPGAQGVSLAMVVMHRGEVVAERYGEQPATAFGEAEALDADSTLVSWSMAKSITHAAIGVLVGDGVLDLDQPAPVEEWRGTPKERIRLIDLVEMRSGLEFIEDYVDGETSHCIAMLFGVGAGDHANYAAALPLVHEPGSVWNYSSGTTNILARIVGHVVGGGREGMERFLVERLFEPAGMSSAIPKFDDVGTFVGSSFVYATARDFARFGELYRNDGVSDSGDRILPVGWLDHGRTFVAHDPTDDLEHGFDYGRHWWMWPQYQGSIAAHGYEGQFIVVVPDRELTVVHLGKTDVDVRRHLVGHLDGLIAAVPISA